MNNLKQDEMAYKLNVSPSSYAQIEQGKRKDLGIGELEKIAQIFNMELTQLLEVDKYTVSITNNNQKDGTQYNSNYCGSMNNIHEIKELKLQLSHKDELILQLKQELETLRSIITLFKQKPNDSPNA